METITREQIENNGGLLTIKGTDNCLGDLMSFDGRGVYDPSFGLVPVSKQEADTHNLVLDAARLEGMDKNCEVGQGSFAYYNAARNAITTFMGTIIAQGANIRRTGKKRTGIEFARAGKVYRGRLSRNYDAFNFRRVS